MVWVIPYSKSLASFDTHAFLLLILPSIAWFSATSRSCTVWKRGRWRGRYTGCDAKSSDEPWVSENWLGWGELPRLGNWEDNDYDTEDAANAVASSSKTTDESDGNEANDEASRLLFFTLLPYRSLAPEPSPNIVALLRFTFDRLASVRRKKPLNVFDAPAWFESEFMSE